MIEARAAAAPAVALLEALADGYLARHAGLVRDGNPWPENRPEQEHWDRGWLIADQRLSLWAMPVQGRA